jgi:hypothetical protein
MVDSTIGNPSKRDVNQVVAAPFDVKAWFARLDEYLDEPFMPEGRQQPANPVSLDLFGE